MLPQPVDLMFSWALIIGLTTVYLSYCYIARYTDVWNRHRESKNTKLYEIGSCMKLFITFELKVIRHEERETHTQSFYVNCFYLVSPQPNQRAATVGHKYRLASPRSESQPSRSDAGTQLCFSQISAHTSGAWRHPNTLLPISIWDFILTSVNDASSPCAREHLR